VTAAGFERVGGRGAVGCAAAVADVQRAVRIRRDELDLHRFARVLRREAVAFVVEHAGHDLLQRGAGHEEVEETRPGDIDLGQRRMRRQRGHDPFRDVARLAAERLRELHRDVAGEVAEFLGAGALEDDLGQRVEGDAAVGAQLVEAGPHQAGEKLFHGSVRNHEKRPRSVVVARPGRQSRQRAWRGRGSERGATADGTTRPIMPHAPASQACG